MKNPFTTENMEVTNSFLFTWYPNYTPSILYRKVDLVFP